MTDKPKFGFNIAVWVWKCNPVIILYVALVNLSFKIQAAVNGFGDSVAQHGNINLSEVINIAREVVGNHSPSDCLHHVPDWWLKLSFIYGLHPICDFL